jgi:YbgC/YbaW family acyl-CoA thioester hydrolase
MAHRYEVRTRFYELDPYEHVNHTVYFGYFEAGRVEALAAAGYGLDVMKRAGFQIVLVELNARFLLPATLHETLLITTSVVEITRATSRWHQDMTRGEDLLATLDVRAAFTNLAGRPTRPPDGFAAAFA